jgi:type IX secretion system PorP/SprF family membrane protein
MNPIKTYLIFFLLSALFFKGQDIHFSQFNEHPSLINPALTGVNSSVRASVGYKDQWRSVTSPYKTYGISYEMRFKTSNWKENGTSMTFRENDIGHFAAGISIYNDNAGNGNMGQTIGNLSLSTFINLNKNSFLSCGLQASLIQRRLDNTKLIFSNQYTGSTYDPGVASGESFSSSNFTYADFASGIVWSYSKADRKIVRHKAIVSNVGFSLYHINKPQLKYLNTNKNLQYFKYVFYGDFLFTIENSNVALLPTYLFQFQGSSKELLGGISLKYYLDNNSKYTGIIKRSSINYGIYYRSKDAVILNVLYERHEQYAIGLSYDLNLSQLASISKGRGGVEIMLRYTPPNAFLYQKKEKIE